MYSHEYAMLWPFASGHNYVQTKSAASVAIRLSRHVAPVAATDAITPALANFQTARLAAREARGHDKNVPAAQLLSFRHRLRGSRCEQRSVQSRLAGKIAPNQNTAKAR